MIAQRKRFILSILIISTVTITPTMLWPLNSLLTDLTVQSIKEARPPEILIDSVIFTYKSPEPVRYVGARFEHEDYRILHLYQRNRNGVFVLVYPLPDGIKKIKYRIVADGVWMPDPTNKTREQDRYGTEFSVVELKRAFQRFTGNPTVRDDGTVTFKLKTNPGKIVTLTGDFNMWDPFLTRMRETEPGLYQVTIRVLPGRHYYYYIVNGDKLLDPLNTDLRTDYEGFSVSSFLVPQPKRVSVSVLEGN